MAVVFRLSGGDLNTSGNGSLGGIMSSTAYADDVIENLFDNVSRNEGLLGRTEYRCIYILNTGGGHISGAVIEVKVNPPLTRISIGLDPAGKGDGVNRGVATNIPTEDTTPSGVKFFGEDILSADGPWNVVKLPLGLLKSGEAVPVWLKRVTEQGPAQTVTVELDVVHDAVTLPGDDVDDGGAIGELLRVVVVETDALIGTAKIGFSEIADN